MRDQMTIDAEMGLLAAVHGRSMMRTVKNLNAISCPMGTFWERCDARRRPISIAIRDRHFVNLSRMELTGAAVAEVLTVGPHLRRVVLHVPDLDDVELPMAPNRSPNHSCWSPTSRAFPLWHE
jgi:hypothetical protein